MRRREPEMRRRETFIAHREFFHAVTIQETVALACTCRRGADHWYGEPMRAADHVANEAEPAAGRQARESAVERTAAPAAGRARSATVSRLPRRLPDRVARAS